jgi:beta-glucosidase
LWPALAQPVRSAARARRRGDPAPAFMTARGFRFPERFLWGAATASHQVEGGNRWNDWWQYEQAGRLPYRSGDACRHYERYEQDFDMARALGHNAHRFSIEWSRIEPSPGRWDEGALQHYVDVVRALRGRGIEPIVTLHHFTNPAWLAEQGGWLRQDAVARFAGYTERVAERLAGEVRYWISVNEPTVYAKYAFVNGLWPPGVRGSWPKAFAVMRNMARAHVAAHTILHRRRAGAMVGFAHSAPWIMACNPRRPLDRGAALMRDLALNRLPFLLLARPPRRCLDFIGINYYNRTVVRWAPRGPALLFGEDCVADHHGEPRRFSDMGWEIYPEGLRLTLERFAAYGVPLMITENGIATTDDELRSWYLLRHLEALADAVARGVPVLGYLYWSLMDNFEWALGTAPRFGLAAVDFDTQERRVRHFAERYAAVCASNQL